MECVYCHKSYKTQKTLDTHLLKCTARPLSLPSYSDVDTDTEAPDKLQSSSSKSKTVSKSKETSSKQLSKSKGKSFKVQSKSTPRSKSISTKKVQSESDSSSDSESESESESENDSESESENDSSSAYETDSDETDSDDSDYEPKPMNCEFCELCFTKESHRQAHARICRMRASTMALLQDYINDRERLKKNPHKKHKDIRIPTVEAYLRKLHLHRYETSEGLNNDRKCEMYDSIDTPKSLCRVHPDAEPCPENSYCWHNDCLDMRVCLSSFHKKVEKNILCRIEMGQFDKEKTLDYVDRYANVMKAIYHLFDYDVADSEKFQK